LGAKKKKRKKGLGIEFSEKEKRTDRDSFEGRNLSSIEGKKGKKEDYGNFSRDKRGRAGLSFINGTKREERHGKLSKGGGKSDVALSVKKKEEKAKGRVTFSSWNPTKGKDPGEEHRTLIDPQTRQRGGGNTGTAEEKITPRYFSRQKKKEKGNRTEPLP